MATPRPVKLPSEVTTHRLRRSGGDGQFRALLRRPEFADVPCISIWRRLPESLEESDLFRLRASAERFRLVQVRRGDGRELAWWNFRERRRAAKEFSEIAGRETGWSQHPRPLDLADFQGLTLLREDFAAIVTDEKRLLRPGTWVAAALKRRFDLQFVPRGAEPSPPAIRAP